MNIVSSFEPPGLHSLTYGHADAEPLLNLKRPERLSLCKALASGFCL
jgi:hypothetical protein